MIAAVTARHAAWAALLLWAVPLAYGAENLDGAVRELAAKTALLAGAGTPVSVTCRNASSLDSAAASRLPAAFENLLEQAGGHPGQGADAVNVALTLSENVTDYLLVEDAHKGDQRTVWIAAWKRPAAGQTTATGAGLEKKLIWEQDEQILDLAISGDAMLVMAPSGIALFARNGDRWEPRQTARLAPPRPWPRDLRGRLHLTAPGFEAFLPGLVCQGAMAPQLTMDCRPGGQPWILESGSRALLAASFAPGRNYFDGHVVTQTGAARTAPPFFSAAAVEDRASTYWLLALADGRAELFDVNFNPLAPMPSWGGDLAGIDGRCGAATQVLATRAGDANEPDAIQSWAVVDRTAGPLTAPILFPGPVTALWTAGPDSALAVARSLVSGRYEAYVVTLACGS
ncbi:MAG: hypothetical protein ACLQPN_11865 [Bryobacteraceae bacterium]